MEMCFNDVILIFVSVIKAITLLLSAYCVYWLAYGKFGRLVQLGIPCPPAAPFVGCMYDLYSCNFQLHLLLEKYRQMYGKVYGIYLQSYPTIVVTEPTIIKHILVKDFMKFHDRKAPFQLPKPYDSFLSIAEGQKWRFLRDALSPAFTPAKLRLTTGVINEVAETLCFKISQSVEEDLMVDVNKYAYLFSLELIVALALGVESNAQMIPDAPIVKQTQCVLQEPMWVKLAMQLPGSYYYLKYIPWTFESRYRPLTALLKKVIKERREDDNQLDTRRDLLSLLLEAQNDSNSRNQPLTDDELVAQVIVFVVAGSETTSTAIATTLYHLALNGEVQQKAYQEVKDTIGECGMHLSMEDTQKLVYLEAVINESLRLYPPVYLQFRTCNKDFTIGGYMFKKGMNVFISTYSVHREKEYWDNPLEFRPERFSDKTKIHPFTFMPFGGGPRNCMGARLAMLEMKIALARILYKFEIIMTEDTPKDLDFVSQATMTISHKVKLKFKDRSKV